MTLAGVLMSQAALAGLLISQVTGGGGDLTGVVGLIGQLGISAVFVWLYYSERKERQAVQATLNNFLEKFGSLVPEAAQTLADVRRSMESVTSSSVRRLEQLVEDLSAQTRQGGKGGRSES